MSAMTSAELANMEALLGKLIDQCDDKEQRLILKLHAQLQSIQEQQVSNKERFNQLRAAAKAQTA